MISPNEHGVLECNLEDGVRVRVFELMIRLTSAGVTQR